MSGRTIGIVGAGDMGTAIGRRLTSAGHHVLITDRTTATADRAAAEAGAGQTGTATAANEQEALRAAIVIVALWHPATIDFAVANKDALEGKIVIDIANPLDETFTNLPLPPTTSAAEELARAIPGSTIIKAFNTTPAPTLLAAGVDGSVWDTFVAGDAADAKAGRRRGSGTESGGRCVRWAGRRSGSRRVAGRYRGGGGGRRAGKCDVPAWKSTYVIKVLASRGGGMQRARGSHRHRDSRLHRSDLGSAPPYVEPDRPPGSRRSSARRWPSTRTGADRHRDSVRAGPGRLTALLLKVASAQQQRRQT